MRCIEIYVDKEHEQLEFWLIETWDVLKYSSLPDLADVPSWLIETWDVLKFILSYCPTFHF